MILPLLLLSGVGLFTFFSGKGACYGRAIAACKAEDAPRLMAVSQEFGKKGDERTCAILRELSFRMGGAQSGNAQTPVPTNDPDHTGNPALGELGAVLLYLETRLPQLRGWAAAYQRAKLPATAQALSLKGAQLQASYPALRS